MTLYLIVSALLSFLSYIESRRKYKFSKLTFFSISSILIFFMGLRKEVGCDYNSYKGIFEAVGESNDSVIDLFLTKKLDIGFTFLARLIHQLGGSFESLILLTSILFIIPVIFFCYSLDRPFLGLNLAFSYFIVVIGFGFIRQGIAIAFLMIAILSYKNSSKLGYLLNTIIASLFHKSAIIFFIPLLFTSKTSKYNNKLNQLISFTVLLFLIITFIFSYEFIFYKIGIYINYKSFQSENAIAVYFVLLGNLSAALIYLKNIRRINTSSNEKIIWLIISLLIFASLPLLFFLKETATYRLSLYLMPIQIYIGSKLPGLKLMSISESHWTIVLSSLSFLILLTWLSFANHAFCWIPYKNILFQ